jgi:hypothetical protein
VTAGLFIQSLTDLIDADGKRDAELDRSVSETIVLILLGAFLVATAILGYASGVIGHRPSLVADLLVALIINSGQSGFCGDGPASGTPSSEGQHRRKSQVNA